MKTIWSVLSILLLGAPLASGQESCGSWQSIPLPAPANRGLAAVSASSASDAWAVWKAVYHWNGATWNLVPAPGLGSPDTVYTGVAAVVAGDAWMVGYSSLFGTPQTLAARWAGGAWTPVPSPVVPGGSNFDAVDARSASDAWAVGQRAGGLPEFAATVATLTAHWNGSAWTAVASPNVSNRSHELLDVEIVAADDVWAVGSSRDIGEDFRTLILHWNGAHWSVVPSPNLPGENILHGVSATGANDAWAVGEAWDGVTLRQLFLHWDGATWTQVEGPGGATICAGCGGDVLAMGASDVWATGSSIGHWDGKRWSLEPEPASPISGGRALRALAAIGPCDAWAVGSRFDAQAAEEGLALRLTAGPTVAVEDPLDRRGVELRVSPNPMRGATRLALHLPGPETVRIAVFDPSGRLVRALPEATLPGGDHAVSWDGNDSSGRPAAAGVYFVAVTAGSERLVTRALRLR